MVNKITTVANLPIIHSLHQMEDTCLNFGNVDPMSLVFNDETTQEPSLW